MVMLSHRGSSGEVEYLSIVARDLTERLNAEASRLEQTEASTRAEELKRSRARILQGSESLRREIAQHLHSTNKLILLLYRLAELANAESISEIRSGLKEISDTLEQIIEGDVRKISAQISPAILRRGVVPALQSLGDFFTPALKIRMELDPELERQEKSDSDHISEKVRLSIYRIAEEALTNALKHAGANTVEVRLERTSDQSLRIELSDNGCGVDIASDHKGVGLGLINDYAQSEGGTARIQSARGVGTTVVAEMPVIS
jgi:signal transduction histidine kinase